MNNRYLSERMMQVSPPVTFALPINSFRIAVGSLAVLSLAVLSLAVLSLAVLFGHVFESSGIR